MRKMTKVGFKRRIQHRRVKKTKIRRKSGNKYKRPISPLFILFTVVLYQTDGYYKWRSFASQWKLVNFKEQESWLYSNMMASIFVLLRTPVKSWLEEQNAVL